MSFQSMVNGAGCLNNSATMIEITKDIAPIIWSCSTANIFKQDVFKLPMLFGFRWRICPEYILKKMLVVF